jgi:hypothetical protein
VKISKIRIARRRTNNRFICSPLFYVRNVQNKNSKELLPRKGMNKRKNIIESGEI